MRIWANKSDHLMRIDKPFLNLIIVDQELKNTLGHHYEYDRSVLKAAKESGIKGMLLGSLNVESNIKGELGVLPVFSQPMWISHGGSHTSSLKLNLIYFIDLAKSFIFKGIFLKRHKLLFVHSVNADQLFGLMLFSLFFGFFYKKLAIVLRYQNEVYLNPLSHLALRVFEKLSKVRLYSDSNLLIQDYAWLTNKAISLIPIPHGAASLKKTIIETTRPKKLRLGTLGNPRDEKGIFEIIEAIVEINKKQNSIEFVIQWTNCNDLVEKKLLELEKRNYLNVKFLKKLLSAQEYLEYINSLDLILCPYWASVYSARTSGVFLDCLTHLKPTLTTYNTWAGQHYLNTPLEMLLVHEGSAFDVLKAIQNFSDNYDVLRLACVELGKKISSVHTPNLLLDVISEKAILDYPFSLDPENLFYFDKPILPSQKESLSASIFGLLAKSNTSNIQTKSKICSVYPSLIIEPSKSRFALFRFYSFRLKILRLLRFSIIDSQTTNVSVDRLFFAVKSQFGKALHKQIIVNNDLPSNLIKKLHYEGVKILRL